MAKTKNKSVKFSRNLEYKIFAQRLSEENIKWLFKERKKFKSWNLLFNELKKQYEQKTNNNRKQ